MAEYLIPIVAVVATVASTAVSVYSSVTSEHQQLAAAHKAEWTAILNAKEKARVAAQEEKDRRRRIISAERAAYGASGLEMEGSPLLVEAETIRNSEENLSRIARGEEVTVGAAYDFGQYQANLAVSRGMANTIGAATQGVQGIYGIGRNYNWWQ